ncbi:SusE domain-containing protein [Urechidicola croceus]|uniref:Uncharacterized protein n=1 Tax=Urechidicola croceus TaxID=1850246 RepID=A0A1D8P6X8_9FLAO|nr:SusE domain-containing protein [Urechidicola croceus]AOW20326.1 hypothetical protein LPB138_06375 [Urechidicola croceus]
MKKILNKILILLIAPIFFVACEDDPILTELNPNATVSISLSTTTVVLESENAETEALTVSWEQPDFGFSAAPTYKILIDKADGDFSNPQTVNAGTELQKILTVSQLNSILLNLEFEQDVPADIQIKVEAAIGNYNTIESDIAILNATSYQDLLDLSTTWGIVGSATPNGWDGPDLPFFKSTSSTDYIAYVTLADGEIKFRENNDWTNNFGDTGADGTLEAGGDNMAVSAGTYKIVFNLDALTYSIEEYAWGLVGSATVNGWDGPDMPLTYDSFSDQWKAVVTLMDGELKVRKNNDWAENYGDTGVDGILDSGGDNITISAGNYLVTVNFNDLSYSIEPTDIWGVVGSAAPNGWDGPDAKFTPDFGQEGVFYLNGIQLADGEIKFRLNDDWAVNYGDTGLDGILEDGGDNIPVTSGTYNIMLDFSNPDSPTYTLE